MKLLNVAVLILTQATSAFADGVTFFDDGIDYWGEQKPAPAVAVTSKAEAAPAKPAERAPFDWQKVMDPRNEDFFREGDYVPPAAFMEVARDPSDQNIRMWHAYIGRKNELAARLQRRLQEYGARHGEVTFEAPVAPKSMQPSANEAFRNEVPADPGRFRIRMYFDSECPHCRRMMGTLVGLRKRGFDVEALQVDERPLRTNGLPFTVARASPDDIKRQKISSVPFLLIGDLKAKVVYKMTGFKTESQIFSEIASGNREMSK